MKSPKPSPPPPKQTRAAQTRERLLDVTGELLAEVGIERISTNMICARAGVTPPALYHYFEDKYAVLEALGRRLMDRQNEVLLAWLDRHTPNGLEAVAAHLEDLLRETARVTAAEPGGPWVARALHATPKLAHIRVESHRFVTERQVEAFAPLLPNVPRDLLWRRVRLVVELGYAIDEMLHEEDLIPRDELFREAASILSSALKN